MVFNVGKKKTTVIMSESKMTELIQHYTSVLIHLLLLEVVSQRFYRANPDYLPFISASIY